MRQAPPGSSGVREDTPREGHRWGAEHPVLPGVGPQAGGGVSSESKMRVHMLFESASNNAPAIVFIDEVDFIAPKRGEGSGGGGGGGGIGGSG